MRGLEDYKNVNFARFYYTALIVRNAYAKYRGIASVSNFHEKSFHVSMFESEIILILVKTIFPTKRIYE